MPTVEEIWSIGQSALSAKVRVPLTNLASRCGEYTAKLSSYRRAQDRPRQNPQVAGPRGSPASTAELGGSSFPDEGVRSWTTQAGERDGAGGLSVAAART